MTAPLTGEWGGYYTQSGEKHPIRASVVQDGDRISGTMIDAETDFERSLFDAARAAGLPPGSDETIDASLRRLHPEVGRAPIRAKSRLPADSRLEGSVDGNRVTFTKTYQGEHFIGYQVGDQEIGSEKEGHSVEYWGRISEDGSRMEGRWTIYATESPKGFIDGAFVLERVSARRGSAGE